MRTEKKVTGEMKMNILKGWITLTVLLATLLTSTMSTNAGVIIAGRGDQQTNPCTEPTIQKVDGGSDIGVIIGGLVGVIIGGFTGVIIGGVTSDGPTDCGVIIGG